MIRVACQTYTWEMLGASWRGKVTDLFDAVAGAGYAGIEITNTMIGDLFDRPAELRRELGSRGLELAAFAYATTGFTDSGRRVEDLEGCRRSIALVAQLPEPRLGLGGAALAGEAGSAERRRALDRAIAFYNEAGRLGERARVSVNVHPHSHYGSLLETAEEYDYLLRRLDPSISLGPDTGHIVRGGQELMACLRAHRPRITHLHLKDVTASGEWAPLGRGVCDFAAVLGFLEETRWEGWVVGEEESESARLDPQAAVRSNREYLRSLGY